ncbi:OLC1v1020031C1 [Oldenlandia corymbosa var. corymbosa]|uniref:OLC1v1020031C1 n=1 Tax=Oldenlandia corymbosa var. corymbosa TaxID=529605 RepID=A0AAV1EFU6_OLDCO|nr:OLC1v1020031C1 [Oldenlandia corymbosa var. corymbosa]
MALPLSKISLSPYASYQNSPKHPHSNTIFPIKIQPNFKKSINHPKLTTRARKSNSRYHIITTKATQESTESNTTSEAETQNEESVPEGEVSKKVDEASQLGAEIKGAMKERAEKEQDLSLNGVAEEIREIEWPAFDKVLGTTWVVLGIIAGSSVVLLTVNAVLAELSDRVFAGRGVQDFFS